MIWSMDADGGNARQLTVDPANDFSALVTPVGRGIVFLSDRSGTRQLWRIDIDGGNPVLLTGDRQSAAGAIFDGGKTVCYTEVTSADRKTWCM